MGRLIDGTWDDRERIPHDERGAFQRAETTFRGTVEADAVAPGRYHLYVAYACPWAHRALIARALLGLEDAISVAIAHPFMGTQGWVFGPSATVPDTVEGIEHLHELYVAAKPDYTGRVTVPVLWDREQKTVVNNESREIMRMFATIFEPLWTKSVELSPTALREQIDEVIDAIFMPVNNGVYRCGFARTQEAYDDAVQELFAALDHWEAVLGRQRYLCGDTLTEADICLFTTLFRFDIVYHTHFKCNVRRIVDYPNLWGFVRDLYARPEIAGTCNVDEIKAHYFRSHASINPTRIVPAGPAIDFTAPHDRG